MFLILPEQHAKMLIRDYRIRLLSVFLFSVSVALTIGIFSIIPSYIFSGDQNEQVTKDLELLKTSRVESGAIKEEKEIFASRDLINKVNDHVNKIPLSGLVEVVAGKKVTGISINSISINRNESLEASITISGFANDRDALVRFKKGIEQDGRFSKVELPLSDLAKSKNIEFSIRTTLLWQ